MENKSCCVLLCCSNNTQNVSVPIILTILTSNGMTRASDLQPVLETVCQFDFQIIIIGEAEACVNFLPCAVLPMVVTVVGRTNIVEVINSTVVIQFSIVNTVPPVKVEDIHWTFTSQYGVTTSITNTTEWANLSLDHLTLAIPRAQLSNIGTYTITASNPAGVSTGSVHLDMHGI